MDASQEYSGSIAGSIYVSREHELDAKPHPRLLTFWGGSHACASLRHYVYHAYLLAHNVISAADVALILRKDVILSIMSNMIIVSCK